MAAFPPRMLGAPEFELFHSASLSVQPLCSLCLRGGSRPEFIHHGDTENTEVAQRTEVGDHEKKSIEILARQCVDQPARSNEQMTILDLVKSLFQLVDLNEMQFGFGEC